MMKGAIDKVTRDSRRRRGFTLLEVVLALVLTLMLISGIFLFYMSVLQTREAGTVATRDVKMARSILTGMANEIRHTTSIIPGDGIGFQGELHKITIVKLGLPENYAFDEYDPLKDTLPPAQLDIRRITYELLWDESKKDDEGVRLCYGLWRTEQKTFDPNPSFVVKQSDSTGMDSGGVTTDGAIGTDGATGTDGMDSLDNSQALGPQPEGELYAPEVKYLEFAYFDGAEWRDRWQSTGSSTSGSSSSSGSSSTSSTTTKSGLGPMDSGAALPQAIRITIGKNRVDPDNEMFDLTKWSDLEGHPEQKPYYPDRFTIVVPILEADRTLMSSRKSGVADGMARQEGGTVK